MNRVAVAFAALLATASTAVAQKATIVYTNIVDGQRVDRIVKVLREVMPASPLPPSITTTPVAPRRAWWPEMGGTGYVPPPPTQVASAPAPKVAPLFIDGIYRGPSPTGRWMSVTHGRPVIDVRLIADTPRPTLTTVNKRSSSSK